MKKIKSAITTIKTAYGSINKQAANSFGVSLGLSFVICLLVTVVGFFISDSFDNMSLALPALCSSLFSTTITFCLTTTVQNLFELKYTDKEVKDRSSKWTVSLLFYSIIYVFVYFMYLSKTSDVFGIIFLVISGIGVLLSLLSFIETYQADNNNISG